MLLLAIRWGMGFGMTHMGRVLEGWPLTKEDWKPAVANGGNTDERARANWTELCWGDYAVRGQGATAVYLRCVA